MDILDNKDATFDFVTKIKKNSLYTILTTLDMKKLTELSKIKKKAIFKIFLSKRKLYDK